MSNLVQRVVSRFSRRLAAASPHVCWYRVTKYKGGNRSVLVSVVAAWKPTSDIPIRKETHNNWLSVEYYDVPDEFFQQVERDCRQISAKAKALVEGLGLKLRENRMEPLKKWVEKSVNSLTGDYVNFFWLSVEVPFGAGQKQKIEAVTSAFAELSSGFSNVMQIELEK